MRATDVNAIGRACESVSRFALCREKNISWWTDRRFNTPIRQKEKSFWFTAYLVTGLEIISVESPDTMTGQIHFSSVTFVTIFFFHSNNPFFCFTLGTLLGSCVLKASVDRVSVDTIGRYGDRHSADISTDTRPICRPIVGRVSVDMNRQACRPTLGRYFTATRPPLSRYFTNTRPTLSSLANWSALAAEFYLPYSTERGFQWLSSFFDL